MTKRLPFDEIEQLPYEPVLSDERRKQIHKELQRYVEGLNELDAERLLLSHAKLKHPHRT